MIDVIIDSEHAQASQISDVLRQTGCQVAVAPVPEWGRMIRNGQAEWLVLLAAGLTAVPVNWPLLESHLYSVSTDVHLRCGEGTNLREWFLWQACTPAVAVWWSDPARLASVCIRRSAVSNLPAFSVSSSAGIWSWLADVALRPKGLSGSAENTIDDGRVWPSDRDRVPRLVPDAGPQNWLVDQLMALKPSQLVPQKSSEADAVAVKAGLLQWHDALDASHQLAQSVEGLGRQQSGDYWHAIMHRREPDYGNAKYWFRQLGSHSVFAELPARVADVLEHVSEGAQWSSRLTGRGTWDPLAFVDLCESCAGNEDSALGRAARHIQALEMQLLLAATFQDASASHTSGRQR